MAANYDPTGIDRLVFEYAQGKYFDRLARAVTRGIITEAQANALMDMWHEEHEAP